MSAFGAVNAVGTNINTPANARMTHSATGDGSRWYFFMATMAMATKMTNGQPTTIHA